MSIISILYVCIVASSLSGGMENQLASVIVGISSEAEGESNRQNTQAPAAASAELKGREGASEDTAKNPDQESDPEPIQSTSAHVEPSVPTNIKSDTDVESNKTQALADAGQKPIEAVVVEVEGRVDRAPAGVSALVDDGWMPVELNERLSPGTQIRTGLRSHVNLKFGESTLVSVRRATYARIEDFYQEAHVDDSDRVAPVDNLKINLGYGAVRGGAASEEIHSKVTVDAPAATLVKRGTDGWEFSAAPSGGRFEISLAREGLVEALRAAPGGFRASRLVRPGERVSQATIANMWISQAHFDRPITMFHSYQLGASEAEFAVTNPTGRGGVTPTSGSDVYGIAGRPPSAAGGALASNLPPSTVILLPPAVNRPEGNFGTPQVYRTSRSNTAHPKHRR